MQPSGGGGGGMSGGGMSGGMSRPGMRQPSYTPPPNVPQYPNRLNNQITSMKMPAPYDGKTGAYTFPPPPAPAQGGTPPIMSGNPQDIYQQWLSMNYSPGGGAGTGPSGQGGDSPSGATTGGDSAPGTGPSGDAW